MEKLYTVSKNKTASRLAHHKLIMAKFRLKESRENHWTFGYDLNQIPYDYTVEVTNRIRSDRVSEELWMEICNIVQEVVIKNIPKKKKCQTAKWPSEEALQIAGKEEN